MRVALLHGFAGDPHVWDRVIGAWCASALPDPVALPGHGGDDVKDGWDANLDVIAAIVGAADVIVGYSFGARVALGLLATGRCERAVLIGVNPGIDDAERPARREHDATWAAMLRRDGVAAFIEAWEAQPLFATQARMPFARRDERRARRMNLDAEQLARSLEHMGLAAMPDYRAELQREIGRASVVVGADDDKFVAIARALRLPYRAIAGSGHDVTLEQPEKLAMLIAKITG